MLCTSYHHWIYSNFLTYKSEGCYTLQHTKMEPFLNIWISGNEVSVLMSVLYIPATQCMKIIHVLLPPNKYNDSLFINHFRISVSFLTIYLHQLAWQIAARLLNPPAQWQFNSSKVLTPRNNSGLLLLGVWEIKFSKQKNAHTNVCFNAL